MPIQLLSKKALQFRNPNAALVNKEAKLGQSNQVKMTTKLEEAVCRITPDKVTLVPDWVKLDPMFKWCIQDGSLMEVVVNPLVTGADLQAKGQQQLADEHSEAKKAESEKAKADLSKKLQAMTKQELVDYASENHDMELGLALKKEDLLAAIEQAEKEKQAA